MTAPTKLRIGDLIDESLRPIDFPVPSLPVDVWEWMGLHNAVQVSLNPISATLRIVTESHTAAATPAVPFDLKFHSAPGQFQVALDELTFLVNSTLWRAYRPTHDPLEEAGEEAAAILWNPYWLTYRGVSPLIIRDLSKAYRRVEIEREDLPDGVGPSSLLRYEKWFREKRMTGMRLDGDKE